MPAIRLDRRGHAVVAPAPEGWDADAVVARTCADLGPLVASELAVLAVGVTRLCDGYLGIVSLARRTGSRLSLAAGVARRRSAAEAALGAALDAVLRADEGAVLPAGAAALHHAGYVRAAVVLDGDGLAPLGDRVDAAALVDLARSTGSGERVAAGAHGGDYRLLSLGDAVVVVSVVQNVRAFGAVREWFDAIEAARG